MIETFLNNELKNVSDWLSVNRLALDVDKTNFVIFHSPKKKTEKNILLYIDGKPIEKTSSVKYLGILLDSNLSWKAHIYELSKKLSKSVRILSKLRYYLPINILILIYNSLIYSFLIYGIETWGQTFPSIYLKPLVTLQKKP